MKRILVATDFSENSKAAFDHARAQALAAGDKSTIVLLCVIEDLAPTSVQFEFALAVIDTKGILDEAYKTAMQRLKELAPEAFPDVRTEIAAVKAKSPVAQEIVEYAKKEDIDMIVMGTHGRSGLSRALLGSVAENVVRSTSCPVLLVPSDKD